MVSLGPGSKLIPGFFEFLGLGDTHRRKLARNFDVRGAGQPQLPALPPGAPGQEGPEVGLGRDRPGVQVSALRGPETGFSS